MISDLHNPVHTNTHVHTERKRDRGREKESQRKREVICMHKVRLNAQITFLKYPKGGGEGIKDGGGVVGVR